MSYPYASEYEVWSGYPLEYSRCATPFVIKSSNNSHCVRYYPARMRICLPNEKCHTSCPLVQFITCTVCGGHSLAWVMFASDASYPSSLQTKYQQLVYFQLWFLHGCRGELPGWEPGTGRLWWEDPALALQDWIREEHRLSGRDYHQRLDHKLSENNTRLPAELRTQSPM
jgi:hypothetical protein